MAIIAPSLLAANFLRLESEIDMFNQSPAEWLHLDVMDGLFVPNISYGLPVIEMLRPATTKLFDVHLMIEKPERFVEDFKKVGADQLTVHYEACTHLHRNIQQIKDLGMRAGVALNPHTPVSFLKDVLQDIDTVLIMSVNPGFGGQKFIDHTYFKIRELRTMIDNTGLDIQIEIDGGVTVDNAATLVQSGATVLVAGNTVFRSSNPLQTILDLKAVTGS